MSLTKCSIINRVWLATMRQNFARFNKALLAPELTQEKYLRQLLINNQNTEFGRKYNFSEINTIRQYQDQVPLTKYSDYMPYIEQIANGNNNVLTTDKVSMFEPSSGSTSASKLIPYNKTIKAEFNRAIAPWLYSMYNHNPRLLNGKAYWSISPAMDRPQKNGVIRVGFDADSEYLGFISKNLFKHISAAPPHFANDCLVDNFRNKTLANLLLCKDLALISVWNPTFLYLLLDHLFSNTNLVLDEVKRMCKNKNISRLNELEKIFAKYSEENILNNIWPNLTLISCWTDGTCSSYTSQMARYFPNTRIQGKGLIATESFVSLPFRPHCDPVLAVNSHFFEFIDDDNNQILTADQVSIGNIYSIVVTTGGGLYRYQLEDLVEITGNINSTPTMRFISKTTNISDHAGEKLNERHIMNCFEYVFNHTKLQPDFFLLAPIKDNNTIKYCIFIQDDNLKPDQTEIILSVFETTLRENYHYDYCRKLGQLGFPILYRINSNGQKIYQQEMLNRQIKQGNIKPASLDNKLGWEKIFQQY